MALEIVGISDGLGNAVAAVLFLQSGMMTLDAYSTFQSSPWTSENFGADPIKMRSAKEYLCHAVGFSLAYAFASAYLAKSWWPVIGSIVANAYLIWLYLRAFKRGSVAGSKGWAKA